MSLKSLLMVTAVASAAVTSVPAAAVTFTQTGATTLASPTFNRPLDGNPPSGLSLVGTAVHYNTLSFTVNTTGSYDFLLSSGTGGFDPFLGLYATSFNPTSPLANVLQYNDDLAGSLTSSGFTRTLTAGFQYISVITGFDNTDVGAYTFTINGPGTVTPGATGGVPEPATWAMMLLGFGGVGYAMRRRQQVSARVRFA